MITHLYAQVWNDEWMLPYFFRHYDSLVDRYFIYDDGSVDATWSLLEAHPRVEARRFERVVPDSFALSEQIFSNDCWKQSRGDADWVIVADIDEHLFHSAGAAYLSRCSEAGVTLVPGLGFQMISEEVPAPGESLALEYRLGAPWAQMMKPSIFDPEEISEINFAPGRHTAEPTGRVEVPLTDELLVLHYKYLGFHRTLERHNMLRTGLGSVDIERGWGHKYSWSKDELRADWDRVATEAVDVGASMRNPQWHYPLEPWWDKYRRRP